jgi:sulfate adenylyltransferase
VPNPQWTPSPRELADLELLVFGALPDGFTTEGPATLVVDAPTGTTAAEHGALVLLDPEGVPVARLTVRDTYAAPRGTGLVGPVEPLSHGEYGPFRQYHRTPGEVRRAFPDAFAVPVREPLTTQDVDDVTAHAAESGRAALLLVCTGPGGPRELSGPGLVRATLAADVPDAYVVAVALAARDDDAATDQLVHTVATSYADDLFLPRHRGDPDEAVAAVVAQDRPPRERRGLVVFFTGLSGSGKSTLARALHDVLLERGDRTVTSLDGDVVRHHLSKGLGFSRADRETNIARIGWVAAEISRHGGVAICSPIAPFDSTRRQVRGMVDSAGGGFVLVHVSTPLEECERRDRKGLYARARAGEIPDFTGISSPYETPIDARVAVDTTGRSIPDALGDVLAVLTSDRWLAENR